MKGKQERVHMHNLSLEEDLVNDFPWKSVVEGDATVSGATKSLVDLLRCKERTMEGYLIAIGTIHRMRNKRASMLYSLSNYDSKIPADLYQWLVLVQKFLSELGYEASLSDILRFNAWFEYPNTIAPNGDLLTGEEGWHPSVIHAFDCMGSDEVLRVDEFHSIFVEPEGMKHCDRVFVPIIRDEFNLNAIKDFFSIQGWRTEIEVGLATMWNGEERQSLFIKVLKENKYNKE